MREHPDSAMSVLLSIDKNKLDNDEEKARHALLMSMALDKNYIDTTTFDVLRQAIDYYLKEGSPDDRLRTLYYQGRIFQNKGENDSAMKCFIKAEDLQDKCTDIITFANMLVAQGKIYFQSYQIEDYTLNNLRAAKLYHKLGKLNSQQSSLIRALDGCIASEDKHKADSLMEIIDSLVAIVPESQNMHTLVNLTYDIGIGSKEHINGLIDSISKLTPLDDETKLNISLGYLRLNEPEKANDIFSLIDTCSQIGQSIRYLSIKPDILEANKKYPEALQAFREYHNASETENSRIYLQKTAVAQELHRLEINYLNSLQHKDTIIWLVVCVILVLIQIIGVIYYQLRLGKKNQIISEHEQSRLQLENENLREKKHNAELELECHRHALENMRLKISGLETEEEQLKNLLTESKLAKPILDSIQERVGILNGLLAAKITDNDAYAKPYDKWINQVTEDRKSFMDSTRLAFKASHPDFMAYLEKHGLNEAEQNYVCLYAIGLRGKEIGAYIQIKRHYHMSTDIRKKLGLNQDDTNLGLHIRNLMKKS